MGAGFMTFTCAHFGITEALWCRVWLADDCIVFSELNGPFIPTNPTVQAHVAFMAFMCLLQHPMLWQHERRATLQQWVHRRWPPLISMQWLRLSLHTLGWCAVQ